MCQVKYVKEIASKPTLKLRIEQIYWRIRKKLRKLKFLRNMKRNLTKTHSQRPTVSQISSNPMSDSRNPSKRRSKDSQIYVYTPLKKGDTVKVRSKEEISQMLDENDKYKGCYFMEEMWQYCGTKQKVLTKVEYFYDELSSVMRKANNIVLLEGLICSGDMHWQHKCDRNCYFFWREEWLEKI